MSSAEVSDYLQKILSGTKIKNAEGAVVDFATVGQHLSIADHIHIHRHLGEPWGFVVDVNVGSGDNLDILVENPADSGNVVEIAIWGAALDGESKITIWRGATFSGTATSVTPTNFDEDITSTPDFNVEHGSDLIDTGNDTQLPGGGHTTSAQGSRINSTVAREPQADRLVSEGSTWGMRIAATDAVNPIISVIVPEYTQGRKLLS